MGTVLRSRRWLGGLAVAVAGAAVCAALGRWQWDRSQSAGGDLQNLAYAFNWWLFALLCLGVWGKAVREEARRPLANLRAAEQRAAVAQPLRAVADDGDAEVADWNAWLGEMNSNPRR